MTGRRWKSRLGTASLALLSFILALVLLEGAVRVFQPQPLAAVRRMPRIGWVHVPGSEFVYERREFRVPVRISSAGLRDREYTARKPPGVVRVAVLGDSFVEALHVPVDSMLSRRLEECLQERHDGVAWQVMNFGVSGYGSCQQLLVLEDMVLAYEPDIVVSVQYHNDLDDNARFGICDLDANGGLRVAAVTELGWVERLVSNLKSTLRRHSHLYVFAVSRRARWSRGGNEAKQTVGEAGNGATDGAGDVDIGPPLLADAAPSGTCDGSHPSIEGQLSLAGWTPEARRAVDLNAAILERMRQRRYERGVSFLAVICASATQVDLERRARELARNGCRPQAHGVWLLNRRVREAARRRHVDIVDLRTAFEAPAEPLFFRWDGHWNSAGHRVAARYLCRVLEQRDMVDVLQP